MDSKIKSGSNVRHTGEVYGLVAFGTGNVDLELFGNRVGDGLVIDHRRSVERNGSETARQRQGTEQSKDMNSGLHGLK